MTTATEVHGICDTRFARVRDAFVQNFSHYPEVGASVSVVIDGKTVVDLWGGYADEGRTRPWQRDTIVNVWSSTKGITAVCAHRLVDQGLLDLDAPVAKYWPAFAQAGKGRLPVRFLLSHQAGLVAVKEPLPPGSAYKWDVMTAALAAQEPWWEPGTKHGYHAQTYGWLVGEVVRRISGKSLGTFLRDEVARPLGVDFHIGLPAEHHSRAADIIPPDPPKPGEPNPFEQLFSHPDSMAFKAIANPPELAMPASANTPEWRAAEIPASGGHGNARALGRVYGALARGGDLEGIQILTPEAIQRATAEQCRGPDAILGVNMRWALGFALNPPDEMSLGPNPRSFGHSGWGGSLGFADPDAGIGFGYAMNKMMLSSAISDPRWKPMIDAVYESL